VSLPCFDSSIALICIILVVKLLKVHVAEIHMILMGVRCNVVRDWSQWPSNTIQTSLIVMASSNMQVPATPSGDFCIIIVNTDKFLYAIDDLDLDETMHWSLNIRIDQTSNPKTDGHRAICDDRNGKGTNTEIFRRFSCISRASFHQQTVASPGSIIDILTGASG